MPNSIFKRLFGLEPLLDSISSFIHVFGISLRQPHITEKTVVRQRQYILRRC